MTQDRKTYKLHYKGYIFEMSGRVNINISYGVKALSCFSPSSLLEAPPHLIFSLQVSTNDMLSSSAFLHAENSKQFRIECNKCWWWKLTLLAGIFSFQSFWIFGVNAAVFNCRNLWIQREVIEASASFSISQRRFEAFFGLLTKFWCNIIANLEFCQFCIIERKFTSIFNFFTTSVEGTQGICKIVKRRDEIGLSLVLAWGDC